MNELLFVEAAIDLDGLRHFEQFRQPSRGFGSVVRGKFPQLGARSLMQDDDALGLTREGRVEQLTREQAAGIWQHEQDGPELAALRLVHGERVGQLENRIAFLTEITTRERVFESGLRGEFHLELPAQIGRASAPKIPDGHADFAISNVGVVFIRKWLAMFEEP